MSEQVIAVSPALAASQASWRCVHARDRAGWLALMADDVVMEDPIGESFTNPDGKGLHGREAVGAFYDNVVEPNQTRITCEETFPSSSPNEIAHILVLHFNIAGKHPASVRGVFTYRVDDAGLLTNLRGYWNTDAMVFGGKDS